MDARSCEQRALVSVAFEVRIDTDGVHGAAADLRVIHGGSEDQSGELEDAGLHDIEGFVVVGNQCLELLPGEVYLEGVGTGFICERLDGLGRLNSLGGLWVVIHDVGWKV